MHTRLFDRLRRARRHILPASAAPAHLMSCAAVDRMPCRAAMLLMLTLRQPAGNAAVLADRRCDGVR